MVARMQMRANTHGYPFVGFAHFPVQHFLKTAPTSADQSKCRGTATFRTLVAVTELPTGLARSRFIYTVYPLLFMVIFIS